MFSVLQLSVNVVEWGEGQVIFRYSLLQQEASAPIELSASPGSALPPSLLCGGAGPGSTYCRSQPTRLGGARAGADEEKRLLST